MERIIGYQYSETGATGYYFYKEKKLLCKITTGLFFPVWIMGMGREWESNYDFNNTILPGVSRKIKDTESGETIAKITYVSAGRYRIGDLIDVDCRERKETFTMGGKVIATIGRFSGEEKDVWIPEEEWKEFEPFFDLEISEEVDESLLLLIASFPMLKFGLS